MRKLYKLVIGFLILMIAAIHSNAWAVWPFQTEGPIRTAPSVADLNGDGNLEIIFGSSDKNIYCIKKNGYVIWKYITETNYGSSSPTLADLDGDGNLEVLIVADKNLYCLDKNGQLVWKYGFDYGAHSSPTLADLNGDGSLEVLVALGNKYLYCIDRNGQLVWKYNTGSDVGFTPAVADLDNDGDLEILITSSNMYYPSYNNLYCLDKNAQLVWKYNIVSGINAPPTIADLDGDGNLEVLVVAGHLYCIDRNGQLVWKSEISGGGINPAPAVADLDGDGNLEILFASQYKFYCLDKNGQLVWKYETTDYIYTSPAIADLDGDGDLEILFAPQYNNFYCLDKNGQPVWRYNNVKIIDSSPIVADLDGNGNLEIMFGGSVDYGLYYLYCLNKNGEDFVPSKPQGPISPMPWPMFQHDLRRTGLYDRTPPTTPVVNTGGPFINHTDTWRADWQSEEKESDIIEYRWKITQDSSEGEVIRDWLSTGRNKFGSADNLALVDGKTYFACVQAKNTQGMWSEVGLGSATVDITPPTTTISGIDSLWHNLAVTVTLTATDSVSDVDYTYYSTDSFITGNTYQGPFTISADGIYTIKYYSLDKAGNAESVHTASQQVKIDKTLPRGKVEINNNVTYSKATQVTLNLAAKDKLSGMGSGAQMQFSNDSITYSTPEAYNPTKSWRLTSGNGTKTVYVKFKDVADNWSNPISDSIILKEKRPYRWGFLVFPWLRR